MKYKFRTYFVRFFLIVLASAGSFSTKAQQDTLFWFAAPEISSSVGDSPVHIRLLSYDLAATVTISQPANPLFTPIVVNLSANSNDSIDLTPFLAEIESPAADLISVNGLKIASTAPITAFYELSAVGNKEIFTLKGQKGIGTEFYTPFQQTWDNAVTAPASFSSIDIVATENNTTVLITPRTTVVGHTGGVTYNILLQEGETYSARDIDLSAVTSLSGSIVASDKPVAVTLFSGALDNVGCTSSMGDQITTSAYAGKDFIVHKGNAIGDKIYILATQNATSITINNSATTGALINWGESYAYELSDTINYIETSKPVYLWHASGYGCNLAGAQVPNLYCAGKYEQSFVRSFSDSLGLLLYTRTGFEGMFAINGNTSIVTSADFNPVPGTGGDFVVGLIYLSVADVPIHTYNMVENTGDVFGMAILSGGSSQGASYGYLSEFNSYPFVAAGVTDTVCANTPFTINGTIGGGSVTGVWAGTGFGSFILPTDSLNNTYMPSALDTIVSPISLILTASGPCPVNRDTLILHVVAAPVVNASADQTVCANNASVSLNGTISGGATTGIWSTISGTGTFAPNATTLDASYIPSSADSIAGNVTLVLSATNYGACDVETDTMVITITNAPFVDAGADTIQVCANNPSVDLTGFVAGATSTGKWSTSGNGLFTPDNLSLISNYQPSPTDVNLGIITLYLESTNNGDCSSAIDSIIVKFTEAPLVNAGINIIACTNEATVNLDGLISGPTLSGVWSNGTGSYSPNDSTLNAIYTPTASEVSAGSLLLTLTSTNNGTCILENDQVQIDFVAPPFANFSTTQVCLGEATTFTDFSLAGFGTIVNWDWDFGDGNGDTLQNTAHTYSGYGTQDVELIVGSDLGCVDTMVQSIEVYELPVANFTYAINCTNNQVVIDFSDSSYTTNDSIASWFYDFGGQGVQAVQNPTQLFIGDGNFVISQIVETEFGCVDTVIQAVYIPPRPEAGFYYNTSNGMNVGAEFSFIDTSTHAVAWSWTLGNGATSIEQDPTTTYFSNGTYVITQYAFGSLGCVDSMKTTVFINTITSEVNSLIPNAISPNGDGKNDVWKLDFIDLINPNAAIKVFNRWGQTLFESTGYQTPWDGTYLGEKVPDGTYYYVIVIGENEVYKGAILVLSNNTD